MRDNVTFFEFGKTHNDVALDVIRVFVGIALFIRGVLFISDSGVIMEIIAVGEIDYFLPSLVFYVAILTHIMGGILMALGLLTRIAALIQIPVLLGAVVIALLQGGLFLPTQSLELSALVLVLLVVFLVCGSGKYSLNYLIFTPGRAKAAELRDLQHGKESREEIATWALARRRAREEAGDESGTGIRILSLAQFHDRNVKRVIRVLQYTVVVGSAIVLLYFGLQSIPFEITLVELGTVAGILVIVLTLFYLFFGWALREIEQPEE